MTKYKLHEMPDMQNEGKHRVYPKLERYRLMSSEQFIESMWLQQHAIDKGVLTAVMMDIERILIQKLSMGYNVKIGGIGTFSLSLAFNDNKPTELEGDSGCAENGGNAEKGNTENGDKMKYRRVVVSNVNFKADPNFLKELRYKTTCERASTGVKKIRKNKYTLEERVARAVEVIEREGMITLTGYAELNDMGRTAASQELRRVCADPTSPITTRGRGVHKIWVKRGIPT